MIESPITIATTAVTIAVANYAIPHAVSAYLARQVLGDAAPRFVTTLHGTDVTHLGGDPSYQRITRFAVERSDGVTAPSAFLRDATYATLGVSTGVPIEVIPNFVDTDHFVPAAARDRRASTRCSPPRGVIPPIAAPRSSSTSRASAPSSALPISSRSSRPSGGARGPD